MPAPNSFAQAASAVLVKANKTAKSVEATKDKIFAPAPITGVAMTSGAGMRQIPTVYELPATATLVVKREWFNYLAMIGRRSTGIDSMLVQNWLLSIIALCYPEALKPLDGKDVKLVTLDAPKLTTIGTTLQEVTKITGKSKDELKDKFAAALKKGSLPDFPDLGACNPADLKTSFDTKIPYAYLGILCLTIHKDVMGSGAVAVTQARPKNYKDKYHWDAASAPHVLGSLAPHTNMLVASGIAWKNMPAARSAFFRIATAISTFDASAEDEALHLMVRMLKWDDLGHMPIIGDFLNDYPEANFCPALQSSIKAYDRGMIQLYKSCPVLLTPDGRPSKNADGELEYDVTQLPYVKIYHTDKLEVSTRKSMEPVLAVALHEGKTKRQSLAAYVAPQGQGTVIAAWTAWLAGYRAYLAELDDDSKSVASATS